MNDVLLVRFAIASCGLLFLIGCQQQPQRHPKMSDAQLQRIHREMPGITAECLDAMKWGGVEAVQPKGPEGCYKFDAPRRWKGLWLGGFETSRFCPEPARECGTETGENIWLEVGPEAQIPASARDHRYAAGMFEVDFIGRKSSFPGSYGHVGASDEEIIMDRLIAMKRVPLMTDPELARLHARGVKTSCLETVRWGGLGSFKDPEECFEKLPPRRWRGLWRNDPNIAYFCPEPATKCPDGPESRRISLEFTSLPEVSGWGGLYKVDFVGRRTAHGGSRAGHGAAEDMVVDRMISMKEIEPPPKQ